MYPRDFFKIPPTAGHAFCGAYVYRMRGDTGGIRGLEGPRKVLIPADAGSICEFLNADFINCGTALTAWKEYRGQMG